MRHRYVHHQAGVEARVMQGDPVLCVICVSANFDPCEQVTACNIDRFNIPMLKHPHIFGIYIIIHIFGVFEKGLGLASSGCEW